MAIWQETGRARAFPTTLSESQNETGPLPRGARHKFTEANRIAAEAFYRPYFCCQYFSIPPMPWILACSSLFRVRPKLLRKLIA